MNARLSMLPKLVVAALVVAAAGCESGTEPPPPATFSLTFDLGQSFGALSDVDRLHMAVRRSSGTVALDTTFTVAGSISLGRVEVPLESPEELLTTRVELFSGSVILFQGESEVQATSGTTVSSTVTLSPVVGSVELDGPLPVFGAIGDRQLLKGAVLFTTGDTVPGAVIEWTSGNPDVAKVVAGSQLESTGEGATTVTAASNGQSASLEVRVEAVVVEVAVAPRDVSVPIGFESKVEAVARDMNGNALERTITWRSSDETIATVDETGVVRGVTLGETSVEAQVGELTSMADVEVTPAPPAIDGVGVPAPGTRSARLAANVTPNGAETTVRFEWSEDETFQAPEVGPGQGVGDGLDPVAVNQDVIRLTPATLYYLRVVAFNDYGETVTDVESFSTAEPSGGFVDGIVSAEGVPVDGVTVQLDDGPTAVTNPDGAYAFDDVALGVHEVAIVDVPIGVVFETTSRSGEVTEVGQVVALDFEGAFLRTSSITGQVSASGLAVPGVTVSLDGPDAFEAQTDAAGRYAFDAVRAGTYEVAISGYDGTYLDFDVDTREVTVGLDETEVADFSGIDTDLLEVHAYAFYGIEGVKPGFRAAPGVTLAVHPTQSDANGGQNALGAGLTNLNGVATIRFRKRDDTGEAGGPTDHKVWTAVAILPAPNTTVQADGVLPVSYSPDATQVQVSDTTDLLNGTVKLQFRVKTIATGAPDSPLWLQGWSSTIWEDTTSSSIGGASSSQGVTTYTWSKNVQDLPAKVFFRLLPSQTFDYGANWTSSIQPSGAGATSGTYLSFTYDGTLPPNQGIDLGLMEITYTDVHVYTGVHHEVDDATSTPYLTGGDDLADARSFTIKLFQNGSLIGSKEVRDDGNINAFRNVPAFIGNTSITAETSDASITIITSTSVSGQGNGGGTVGRIGSNGGYRHSLRVCGHRADTIISQCSGFAYKYNNTRIQGKVTQGGGGASGVTVTLKRCRAPQNLGQSACASYDGFEIQDTTNGSGDYSFTNLLEGIYEVRPAGGPSKLVKPVGKSNVQTVNLTIP